MAIYDISEIEKAKQTASTPPEKPKGRLFSSLTTRLLFLLLFIADMLWLAFSLCTLLLCSTLTLLTLTKVSFVKKPIARAFISIKRALVCGLSTAVALFSPALGIMIACTYFLMYDKAGIDEVVPSSLQDQFKEFSKHT